MKVHIMALIECPFCNEILEVEPPDKLHTAFSFVNPIPNSYYGDIVKTKHNCPITKTAKNHSESSGTLHSNT